MLAAETESSSYSASYHGAPKRNVVSSDIRRIYDDDSHNIPPVHNMDGKVFGGKFPSPAIVHVPDIYS